MFVIHHFELDLYTQDLLHDLEPQFGFNGFGEFIFYRTYSRMIDGHQENWADCIIRVINGVMSIRKDWYIRNHIPWEEKKWQLIAKKMAISAFKMEWLPPGRGLWAMGTNFIYERGSMALYNCAFENVTDYIGDDLSWAMDSLMLGVGVGFSPLRNDNLKFKNPRGHFEYVIPDSREGWAQVPKLLFEAYIYGSSKPIFIYDKIREAGLPISGFGGVASGPAPLRLLADQIEEAIERYIYDDYYDSVMLKTDCMNQIGCCVVAGNVRRSAELASGKISDPTFKDLKNYKKHPYRKEWGWMSNNSVILETDDDFDLLPEIAHRVRLNGEPGYLNLQNFPKGRIGKRDHIRPDKAVGVNPCITGDTKIAVADGRGFIPIKETLEQDVDVYCVDEYDEITIRRMRHPRLTGELQKILKVIFDDGSYVRVTPNHRFMKRDRSFVEAIHLVPGDSLAVMRRYVPENCWDNYISVGFGGKTYSEHRLIAKNKYGIVVDYHYDNPIESQTLRFYREIINQGYDAEIIDDQVIVIKTCEGCKQPFTIKAIHREHACCSLSCNNTIKDYSKNIESNRKVHAEKKETLKDLNHRVSMVIEDGYEDVYNGTVDDYHNFIIGGWESETLFGRKIQVGIINAQCGEILLEHREVCNIDETFPTVCKTVDNWYKACKYATLYTTTVSLLPTHQPSTNRIVARNRRIGVGLVDFTGWTHEGGVARVTKYLRKGYKIIRTTAANYNAEAGVPEPIRVTTVKPGGTIPKLAGKTSGMMYPNFHETLRRVRIARNHPIHDILVNARVPYEADLVSSNTDVFEWPILMGPAESSEDVSIWQQAMNLILLQREWADNAVSNTLNFRPKWKLVKVLSIFYGHEYPYEEMTSLLACQLATSEEEYTYFMDQLTVYSPDICNQRLRVRMEFDENENVIECYIYEYDPNHEEDDLEAVLAAIAPLTKSVSLLPHSVKGAYPQMPEEGLTTEEYLARLNRLKKIDWSALLNSDGHDEKFCTSDSCQLI